MISTIFLIIQTELLFDFISTKILFVCTLVILPVTTNHSYCRNYQQARVDEQQAREDDQQAREDDQQARGDDQQARGDC